MTGMWKLLFPLAAQAIRLPEGKCSPVFYTRLMERCNLSVLHAALPTSLPASTCSLLFCPPHSLSSRAIPL